jgi:hypothetical protein
MKIVVSGRAAARDGETGEVIGDRERLQAVQGLRFDEDLIATYLADACLDEVSISGGAIELQFDAERGELRVISEFWVPEALNEEQLEALIDQTQGQWSDGIGEACFDAWSAEQGIDLDLAPFDLDDYERPVAEQVDDGRVAPRFAHLAKAVWNRRLDVVRQAVAEGADLDAIYDGHSALHLAIVRDEAAMAVLLIEGGADVERANPLGVTPLMACASMAQEAEAVAVAKALLARGARAEVQDMDGKTAAAAARKAKRKELAALLAAHEGR